MRLCFNIQEIYFDLQAARLDRVYVLTGPCPIQARPGPGDRSREPDTYRRGCLEPAR
jgi:hypothetical protein